MSKVLTINLMISNKPKNELVRMNKNELNKGNPHKNEVGCG